MKPLHLLFIGNSHTYFNDMPSMVVRRAARDGWAARAVMLAHGGWFLSQHAKEPEVRWNILFGGYDYVILQEHAHPFGPEERFLEAAEQLTALIREAGSTPVIYACWARKDERDRQPAMDAAHRRAAESTGALLAPVGEAWWPYLDAHPGVDMYAPDGAHASPEGSSLAAAVIWETLHSDLIRRT